MYFHFVYFHYNSKTLESYVYMFTKPVQCGKKLSMYKINKLQYGKCFVRCLRTRCFVSEISLVRCAHSFDFQHLTNLCVNTVRTHFYEVFYIYLLLFCYLLLFATFLFLDYRTHTPSDRSRMGTARKRAMVAQ